MAIEKASQTISKHFPHNAALKVKVCSQHYYPEVTLAHVPNETLCLLLGQ